MSESLIETASKLKATENSYFKKFNEFYPTRYRDDANDVFGPSELYDLAIEAEVLLASLGPTAVKRLMYVGFDLLFPFNNPVDWYNWMIKVRERKISNTIYFSISMRIATELKRIELHLENKTWDRYCLLSESEFSISKERYLAFFVDKAVEEAMPAFNPESPSLVQHININEFLYNEKTESTAINHLDQLNKKTGIWSNVVNVATAIAKLSGFKPL